MIKISYSGYRFPPEIIQHAIWLYIRFTLSFRGVEDLLAERGIMVSYETVRRWVNHFGPMVAADLHKRRPKPHTTWHLDEVYLKIDGRMVYLWRAVDDASDDLLGPSPLLGDWLMRPPLQLILDLPERCPHAIAPCYPLHEELPTAVAFTDEGKAEEVEGFRLSVPTLSASICRKATELYQASLVRIERQRELFEPLAHVVPEPPGVSLALKAHDEVVGITHDDHVIRGLAPSPALGP